MKFTYSVKVRSDGVRRIGRECVPVEKFKAHLNGRRAIINRGYKTPCWEWTGSWSNRRGYGAVMFLRKTWRVNRLAWTLYRGPIPTKMEVCHHCDNPKCFRPTHLFLGTHLDNMRDAYSKNRVPAIKGERHGHAKLSEKQVLEIRSLYVPGTNSRHVLARRFGVHHGLIYQIVTRQIWKHI